MNILFVSHRLPYPPRDGARVRAFHMIRHLAGRGDVTVASLVRSPAEYPAAQDLAQFCRRVVVERISPSAANLRMVGCLAAKTPSSMGYFHSPALQGRIDNELQARPYDLVVVHCSSVAPYVEGVDTCAKLLDFVDMDSQKWLSYSRVRPFPLSLGYWLEGKKLQNAEAALAARFDVCTCITSVEFATLRSLGVANGGGWFPNGVDLDYFSPAVDAHDYDSNVICFIGRMDYYPNVQAMLRFCRETLPIIQAKRPNARLMIVGADPVRAVRKLASLPGVEVTGTVPDVRPYLRQAAVSIAPLEIARGMQNKILEAMASGVPVVASHLAAAGIDADLGEHLLAADAPEEVADIVLGLMSCFHQRRALSEAGRRRVEERYSWQHAMRRFDHFIELCLNRGRPNANPAEQSRLTRI